MSPFVIIFEILSLILAKPILAGNIADASQSTIIVVAVA